jgi:AcrR family transcriptional regulator
MPSIVRTSPKQRRRRRSTKAETRERLIAAAVKLLHKGGESAVTTVSVTREAGITQSAFYQHFANVGDCLGAAADRACREIREAVENHRQRMLETRSGGAADLERAYRDMFGLATRQRPIMELFLRHRSDPLALGGAMYRLARGLSSDLGGRLAARAAREGIQDPPADLIESPRTDWRPLEERQVNVSLGTRGRWNENLPHVGLPSHPDAR